MESEKQQQKTRKPKLTEKEIKLTDLWLKKDRRQQLPLHNMYGKLLTVNPKSCARKGYLSFLFVLSYLQEMIVVN